MENMLNHSTSSSSMCLFANIYGHCIISWINKNILKKDQKMGREMPSVKPVPSKDK